MPNVVCMNETCPEYLIRKANPTGIESAEITCGSCGQTCVDDTGQGVDEADRPNPAEPLVLPDPNA